MLRLLPLLFATGLVLAGCSTKQPAPTDTGSMATPAPVAGSGFNAPAGSTTSGVDTGSARPVRTGTGMMVAPRTSVDTGSMSVPAAK